METRSYDVYTGEKPMELSGVAVVFNEPAKLGNVTEIISRGALANTDLTDVCLLTNHDGSGIPLARSPKTLTLEVTDTGLEMRAVLPDTEQGRALHAAVQRGDLGQMSFAFDVGEHDYDTRTQTRTIRSIKKVYEISVVNHAAYKQTSVQARAGKDDDFMNINQHPNQQFNPITGAIFDNAAANNQGSPDTHSAPEYRSAFFKTLLGHTLNEAETRAYGAAQAEKRADSFNTLSDSAAVIPANTLNEVIKGLHPQGGLYNEVRMFSVPANMSIPVGTPTDPAQWHTEGAAVDRNNITTHNVSFGAYELIKVLSLSAAAKRMTLAAFESYLTEELRNSITDALGAAIVNGTGSGQPQGLLTGITWGTGNSLSSPASNIIDGVLKTIAKLPAGYSNGAKFAMNTATLFTSIYPAKTNDGALILIQDAQNGTVRRLFGFPIVIDDNIPVSTIVFGNFKYYGVNIPSGVAVETSRESGFTSGLIDYRALCIADAKPIVPAAFVKLSVAA